jgi:hypothetical protein
MMEMLARFERGETEGGDGSGVNGLEELLKGMGGLEDAEQPAEEEGGEEEGFDVLEALKQRLSDNSDLGQSIVHSHGSHRLTTFFFPCFR